MLVVVVVMQVVIGTMIATSADDTTVMRTARIDAIVIGLIDTAPSLLCHRKTTAVIVPIEAGEMNGTTAMIETGGTEIAETEHDGMNGTVETIRARTVGITTIPGTVKMRDAGIHTNVVDQRRALLGQKPMVVRETIATALITAHLESLSLAEIDPATGNQMATLMVGPMATPRNSKKTARGVWLKCSPMQQTWK